MGAPHNGDFGGITYGLGFGLGVVTGTGGVAFGMGSCVGGGSCTVGCIDCADLVTVRWTGASSSLELNGVDGSAMGG